MRLRALFIAVLAVVGAVGCAVKDEPNVCLLAAEHVAACNGSDPPEDLGASCSGDGQQVAEQALATSCEALVEGGKADAFSSGTGTAICIGLAVPLFAHGLPEKSLCCFDWNCEGALVCRKFACVKQSPMGGPCERVNHCQDGLACKNHKCATPVAQGGSCDTSAACEADLVCDPHKRCNEPAADGATCKADEQCESYHCAGGKCVTPSDVGGPCGAGRGICADDLVCNLGSCAEPPASHASCDRANAFPCPNDETCWNGSCERVHAEGGACERLFDCKFGLFCNSGKCGPL